MALHIINKNFNIKHAYILVQCINIEARFMVVDYKGKFH